MLKLGNPFNILPQGVMVSHVENIKAEITKVTKQLYLGDITSYTVATDLFTYKGILHIVGEVLQEHGVWAMDISTGKLSPDDVEKNFSSNVVLVLHADDYMNYRSLQDKGYKFIMVSGVEDYYLTPRTILV